MVASIGKIASRSQGVSYYEKDGYYARDDPAHREASAWVGKGAKALGLSGPVEPEAFQGILEGEVPGGRRLGRRDLDGNVHHRPGRDVTFSAPKSVSLMALVWCLTNTLTNLRVLLAVGCVALPRVVTATARHRALPTTKMPSHLHKRICETPP